MKFINHDFLKALWFLFWVVIIALILSVICYPRAECQDYSGGKTVQQKIDVLWNYIRGMNYTDCGASAFDTASLLDTVYTHVKFDTILAVSIIKKDSTANTWDQTFWWNGSALSDSSFVIGRRIKYTDTDFCDDYFWIAVIRLKRNF